MAERRKIKVLFRKKNRGRYDKSKTRTLKVFSNLRVPGQRQPKQLHLGYLVPSTTGTISDHVRARITTHLEEHWDRLFGHRDVSIDWSDAEAKLQLRVPQQTRQDRFSRILNHVDLMIEKEIINPHPLVDCAKRLDAVQQLLSKNSSDPYQIIDLLADVVSDLVHTLETSAHEDTSNVAIP